VAANTNKPAPIGTEPDTPANEWSRFETVEARKTAQYWFNMALVSFRGQTKIRHFKKTDNGSAAGPYAFDLRARPDFQLSSKYIFDTGAWGLFGMDICGDHALHICNNKKKADNRAVRVHLAVYNPGSVDGQLSAICASNNGFVFENIGSVSRGGGGDAFKVTRASEGTDATAIERFTVEAIDGSFPKTELVDAAGGGAGLKVWELYHA